MRTTIPMLTCLLLCDVALAGDPLDRVSGTEGWQEPVAADVDAEWRNWYVGRVRWRRARRELRRQLARNRRIAALLLSGGRQRLQGGAGRALSAGELRSIESLGYEVERDGGAQTKVPVERLDDQGQAIDDEGDRLFDSVE